MTDQSDAQFFDVLRASADFLYRQGVGDGACAVDEAIRRLQSGSPDGKMEPTETGPRRANDRPPDHKENLAP